MLKHVIGFKENAATTAAIAYAVHSVHPIGYSVDKSLVRTFSE
jgi:hypothetical protein